MNLLEPFRSSPTPEEKVCFINSEVSVFRGFSVRSKTAAVGQKPDGGFMMLVLCISNRQCLCLLFGVFSFSNVKLVFLYERVLRVIWLARTPAFQSP